MNQESRMAGKGGTPSRSCIHVFLIKPGLRVLLAVSLVLGGGCQTAAPKSTPPASVAKVSTLPGLQKWNPLWWFGNADDPVPPDWYRPGSICRRPLWQLRNPLHNFSFYVIGVADRPFTRSGKFPEAVFAQDGGWNWAVTRCGWLRLPFLSFYGARVRFYLGWRERGNFGGKVNFGKLPVPNAKPKKPDSNPE